MKKHHADDYKKICDHQTDQTPQPLSDKVDKVIREVWYEEDDIHPASLDHDRSQTIWYNIHDTIDATQKQRYVYLSKVAAMMVATLFTGLLTYRYIRQNKQARTPVLVENRGAIPLQTTLPDGSTVTLNRNSCISYQRQQPRAITLKGEAFFEVVKDKHHPFTVATSALGVTVLGTTFNVSAYQYDVITSVSLVAGRVQVNTPKGLEKHLKSQQELTYDQSDASITVQSFNPDQAMAWRSSRLVCDNMPMKVLFQKMRNYYGIAIHVDGAVAPACTISGKFELNKPVEDWFNLIQFSHGFVFTQTGEHAYSVYDTACG